MQENISPNILEQEIAELSAQIEQKRAALEQEPGAVEEKEVISQVIKDEYDEDIATGALLGAELASDSGSAVEPLKDELSSKVTEILSVFQEEGIAKAMGVVKDEHPSVIDAFHDKLVDELYDKLKEKGIVN